MFEITSNFSIKVNKHKRQQKLKIKRKEKEGMNDNMTVEKVESM